MPFALAGSSPVILGVVFLVALGLITIHTFWPRCSRASRTALGTLGAALGGILFSAQYAIEWWGPGISPSALNWLARMILLAAIIGAAYSAAMPADISTTKNTKTNRIT